MHFGDYTVQCAVFSSYPGPHVQSLQEGIYRIYQNNIYVLPSFKLSEQRNTHALMYGFYIISTTTPWQLVI